jgi:crotonyl-CoA carboxylase/reductase
MAGGKDLYEIGDAPPVGFVPAKMHAWVIREERFGPPVQGFKKEVLDVPEIADDEALVYVMAAGVNYNNVWSALGVPVNVIAARNKAGEPEPFHVGGSDASGIVYKVGRKVRNIKVGDEVVVHCGTWAADDPQVRAGGDPMYASSFRIWGYETNWGSFAQFTRVQAHQCLPRPKHLTWEQSAAYMLVGATAYRMLMGWAPHDVRPGDVVLIWGGAGGLGSMAIQIVKAMGGVPIAVVSEDDKFAYCQELGAKGCINRKRFDHWGMLPHWKDNVGYNTWLKGVRAFGKALWDVLGEKKSPRIVFEHPGESTVPTSIFVCDTGGMVAICAGTSGFNATVDLRYLWMRQKRLQGSHFANDEQSEGFNNLVLDCKVDPCMSRVFTWDELPTSHQLMYENKHPHGNMSILVGAPAAGLGVTGTCPFPARAALPEVKVMGSQFQHGQPPLEPVEEAPVAADDTRVGDIMHCRVVTCAAETGLNDVAKLLVENHIHAVVIVDDTYNAVGVVSQTDLVLARQGRSPDAIAKMKAADVMTRGLVACEKDTPLTDAVTKMTRLRIHRLVVVKRSEGRQEPIGVISMTDIIRRMIGLPTEGTPCVDVDEER